MPVTSTEFDPVPWSPSCWPPPQSSRIVYSPLGMTHASGIGGASGSCGFGPMAVAMKWVECVTPEQ